MDLTRNKITPKKKKKLEFMYCGLFYKDLFSMGKSDTTSLFHVSFHEKKKLSKCDARVLVCYGCSLNFKRNWQGPLPQFDFIIVKKLRRLGMKYLATPSNAYFMLFVIILFINPLNVFSVSI